MMLKFQSYRELDVAVLQQAKGCNKMCGDSYLLLETEDYFLCAIADGLGSGEFANQSSLDAITVIKENEKKDVWTLLELCNRSQFAKRGVVITILKFDYQKKEVQYSNVGNISFIFTLPNGKVIRPIPKRGFLSGKKLDVKKEKFPLLTGSTFLLFSDGISLQGNPQHLSKLHSVNDAADFIHHYVKGNEDDRTIMMGRLK